MSFLALMAASVAFGLPGQTAGARPARAGAAGSPPVRSAVAAADGRGSAWRSFHVSVSPAPDDLALVEIGFRGPRRGPIPHASLRVSVSGPFGDDYLALAAVSAHSSPGARALLLIDNRPSPLLDPVTVTITLRARRALGRPELLHVTDPLKGPHLDVLPALCSLPLGGSPLQGGELRALASRGVGLPGFGPAAAVAEAYDLVCGLTHSSAFAQAVADGCRTGMSCPPTGAPVPAPAPTPTPTPPPGCQPCTPAPGRACPLAVSPAICVAGPLRAGRRAQLLAH